ncbi:dihydroxyacetone kinase Dak1 [Ophidiomyces ophidiicola]|nr:dihydroxyacetone kinase Dak1 [Ophidiomyces ophidiicola]KAI2001551.1 dihydroxyacetone kinase Dak1 [Ophidiomyces ophidiicola]KAI2007131.1 dihydroxyacetone kinase Dak1 [Ophidiomyces ophidiicola]KAI2033639.1 dihydroxyacetone kinase Dak1 [Ophidiomyces ophidiicola]KAI2042050.1 dihydroxyacetone kinase Dak1 [Ophidiomyces ophidiicola]
MQTKHFFEDPTHLVNTALKALTFTNPSVALDEEYKIIYRHTSQGASVGRNVSIVSGGGSGHEPAFAGFVGRGFLTASVAGTIFASPSAEQVRKAIMEKVETSKGVLIVTVNYTGDVLNFGVAAEKAKAAGIQTEFFSIGDDVGVGRTKGGKVGRRGIGGSILLMKIIGALAETGASLSEVYATAQLVSENLVSLGSSLEHVHVPGRVVPNPSSTDMVPNNEIEVGMGIHNEPGSHRIQATLEMLIQTMLKQLLDQTDQDRAFLQWEPSDKFVLFINNLGGVSTLELSGITAEVMLQLEKEYKIKPIRLIQGTFLTSLNGMGFSISLLRVFDTGLGPEKSLLDLLDAPAEAVGWAAPIKKSTWEDPRLSLLTNRASASVSEVSSNLILDRALFKTVVTSGANRLISAEGMVTHFDTIVGDGDCGVGLKRGAESVLHLLNDPSITLNDDILRTLNKVISVVETNMDGTSGAIYAIFLNALAHGLKEQDSPTGPVPVNLKTWTHALQHSLKALAKYTPARPGDRTLMDALVPFIDELAKSGDTKKAASAARKGAESTKAMKASLGRTVYIGSEDQWVGKIPDPGAYGLSEFLSGLADGM